MADESRPFGIGAFRPKCLQGIATIQGYVLLIATYSVFTSMFGTYTISQITTMEKHFGLTSQQSGFQFTVQDVGFLIMSPFMGIIFCRLHRPRVIAVCCIAQAFSNLCFFIPFILHMSRVNQGETLTSSYANDTNAQGLCVASLSVNKTCEEEVSSIGSSDRLAYGLMVLGMILNGAGATGLWTLGIAYIDDNAGPLESPKYLGLLFCIRFIAPIIGSMMGSGVGKIHVHLEKDPKDHWVGAWWLGYIVIGIVTAASILPLSMFPRQLVDEKANSKDVEMECAKREALNDEKDDSHANHNDIKIEKMHSDKFDWRDLHRSLIRILTNMPFIVFIFGLTLDIAGGVAYASFLPKYLEDHFYVESSVSNLIMGVCVPVADAIGFAISGFIMSVSRTRLSKLLLIAIFFDLGVSLACLTLMIPSCPTVEMQGINRGDLLQDCNMPCQCDLKRYSPVCGADQMTYYSPCFAGCTDFTNQTYRNCACLASNTTMAVKGLCTDQCDSSLAIYAALLFIINLIGNCMVMVFWMFILRVVDKKDKSLAQSFVTVCAAVGSMPAATLFGKLIDSFCVLQFPSSSGCDAESGACLRYDRDKFRFQYHGLSLGLRIFGCLWYFVVWYGVRKRKFAGDDERKKRKIPKKCCTFDLKAAMDK